MLKKILRSVKKISSFRKTSSETRSLVAKGKKFAFVHIPKTAGMTMSAILEQKFPKDKVCPIRLYPDLIKTPREELNRYLLFRGHFPYDVLSCILDEPFTCITVLREPVARYYSYYKFMKKRQDLELSEHLTNEVPLIRKMDFKDFAASTNMVLVKDGLNQQCRYLCRETPKSITLPYQADEQDLTVEEVERAKIRLASMEVFGLAERFQDSLFLMSFTFGWEPIMDTLILNASGKSDLLEISEETRTLVEEKNKPDVELFKFAEILFETKYQNMLKFLVDKYGKNLGVDANSIISQDDIFKLLKQNAKAQTN